MTRWFTEVSSDFIRAVAFATLAHQGQKRKYTNEDYIVHPIAVSKILYDAGIRDEHILIAAVLHDTVEDTGVTIDLIRAEFGKEVADLVWWLTDQSKPEDGNREARKTIDRLHLGSAPRDAQTIKIADLIDNTLTIETRDPDFYRVYRHEKQLLLDELTLGNSILMMMARNQIAPKVEAA